MQNISFPLLFLISIFCFKRFFIKDKTNHININWNAFLGRNVRVQKSFKKQKIRKIWIKRANAENDILTNKNKNKKATESNSNIIKYYTWTWFPILALISQKKHGFLPSEQRLKTRQIFSTIFWFSESPESLFFKTSKMIIIIGQVWELLI